MISNNFNISNEKISTFIEANDAVLLYFSTNSCSVGEALEPKVQSLITSTFPKIKFISIDLNNNAEIAENLVLL